jgi:hypothetical protein
VSDERRRAADGLHEKVDEISTNLTRVTTMLELNFDPETGHVTEKLKSLASKVDDHDKFITRAKWTLKLASLLGSGGIIAALKAKFGGQN